MLPLYGSTLLTFAYTQLAFCASAVAGGPSVTVRSGVVVGTTTNYAASTAIVSKYIGIPFASSPPRRFDPPEAASSWTAPIQAVQTKAACFQQFNYPEPIRSEEITIFNNPFHLGPDPAESEDCLYLNIYVPPNTTRSSGKAVMFWLFGGGLNFGTSMIALYDGSSFAANQDVIVVTPNYRTNVFGFPNSPEILKPYQNLGFLDQRFALNWVRENIIEFGGSPDRVTVFGESAGGYSARQLMALPPNPITFSSMIFESIGGGISNSTMSWDSLVNSLGCNTAVSPLACVRSKPATTIKSIIEHGAYAFGAVEDNITAVADLDGPINAGTAAKIPILAGSNHDEYNAIGAVFGLNSTEAFVNNLIKAIIPIPSVQKTIADLVAAVADAPILALSSVLTNQGFLCPTAKFAALTQSKGYLVWRYLYDASFPNTEIFPDSGAYHSAEITEVFGTYPRVNATNQQIQLSRYMQTAWANFAKNPNGGPGWPAYGTNGSVGVLGEKGSGGETTQTASRLDGSCLVLGFDLSNLFSLFGI